jgi:hypothetical protein
VTVVDTGTALVPRRLLRDRRRRSVAAGGDAAAAVAAAERTAASVPSMSTVAELERGRSGGRLVVDHDDGDGAPILLMNHNGIAAIGSARTADDAAAVMLDDDDSLRSPMRIGVGDADAGPVVDELAARRRAQSAGAIRSDLLISAGYHRVMTSLDDLLGSMTCRVVRMRACTAGGEAWRVW